jgi:hypothetical protein
MRYSPLPHPNKHLHSVSGDVTSMKRETATFYLLAFFGNVQTRTPGALHDLFTV